MANIRIKKLSAENFMSYKNIDMDFTDRTLIKGRNRAGKTTVKHLVNWILLNKNASGKAPDKIRPHDADGTDIDFVDIVGQITLDIDGREVTVRKVQKQKWIKSRGTNEQRFDGNLNIIYVNDIEKSEKDFKAWLNEVIGEDTLANCMNANLFFDKAAKDRRKILFDSIPTATNEDVISLYPELEPVRNALHSGTPEEISIEDAISAVKRRINGKGRGDKGLKGMQDAIPIQIAEASRTIVDISSTIAEIDRLKIENDELARKADMDSDIKKKSDELTDRKLLLTEEKRKAEAEAAKGNTAKRTEVSKAYEEARDREQRLRFKLLGDQATLDSYRNEISRLKASFDEQSEAYKRIKAEKFDDSAAEAIKAQKFNEKSLVCPTCGRPLTEAMADELRANFEADKAERLSDIAARKADFEGKQKEKLLEINRKAKAIQNQQKEIEAKASELEKSIAETKAEIETANKKTVSAKAALDALPEFFDLSDNSKVREIDGKLKMLDEEFEALTEMKGRYYEALQDLADSTQRIIKLQESIKPVQAATERVEALKAELRKVSQQIADAERELDMLSDFNRKRINLITDRINSHFKVIKWRMFRPLVNGDFEECCEALVNGTSYDGNLNTGDRLLAEVDLLTTFQEIAGVSVPIFLDSAGELDSDRLPHTDCQMIILKRDDCELTIGEA